jgi:hypothetical protein
MTVLVETETWSGKGVNVIRRVLTATVSSAPSLFEEFEEVRGAGASATKTKPLFRVLTIAERNNPSLSGREPPVQ